VLVNKEFSLDLAQRLSDRGFDLTPDVLPANRPGKTRVAIRHLLHALSQGSSKASSQHHIYIYFFYPKHGAFKKSSLSMLAAGFLLRSSPALTLRCVTAQHTSICVRNRSSQVGFRLSSLFPRCRRPCVSCFCPTVPSTFSGAREDCAVCNGFCGKGNCMRMRRGWGGNIKK
jgi:hypothetical protein